MHISKNAVLGLKPNDVPDWKVHGANMGPVGGRQDPGGLYVGPMDLAIWGHLDSPYSFWVLIDQYFRFLHSRNQSMPPMHDLFMTSVNMAHVLLIRCTCMTFLARDRASLGMAIAYILLCRPQPSGSTYYICRTINNTLTSNQNVRYPHTVFTFPIIWALDL